MYNYLSFKVGPRVLRFSDLTKRFLKTFPTIVEPLFILLFSLFTSICSIEFRIRENLFSNRITKISAYIPIFPPTPIIKNLWRREIIYYLFIYFIYFITYYVGVETILLVKVQKSIEQHVNNWCVSCLDFCHNLRSFFIFFLLGLKIVNHL